MRRTLRFPGWAGALLIVGATACAGRTAGPDPFTSGPGGRAGPVLLTVDNQDFRDATIYANWNGRKRRLGTVTGETRRTFEMQWLDYELSLEVDFLGGGEIKTGQRISVLPGEHIDYIIMAQW
jgi:hypothetical protein